MPHLSLRAKLILGALLVLVAVLALLLYSYQAEYERRREVVLDGLFQTAQLAAVPVDSSFEEALALAQTLADDLVVRTLDPNQLDPYLERLTRYRPDLNNLVVVDAAGDLVASAVPGPEERVSVTDRRYFQQVMATGAPVVSDVLIGRIVLRPVMVTAAPIVGPAGRPVGVTIVSVKLDALAQRLGATTLRPGQSLFLTDRTGRLAFHTMLPDLSWEERDVSGWPEVQAALAGEAMRAADLHNPLLKDQRLAAFVPTPTHGWVVGVTWSSSEAFGPVEQANRERLLAFGGIALVAILGMVGLATYLTAPLLMLAGQARALGHGDLTRRVTIKTGDELEELGKDFNAMAERLQATLSALAAARNEAETRARELEEERRRREIFTSAVAHDLKNLMTPLLGTSQLLLRSGPQLPEKERARLGAIVGQTQRLNRLVADLLDVSRIEAGRFTIEREPTDLVALAHRIVEEQQAITARHRLLLDALEHVEGNWDPDRLAQVLSNLVNNAVKYTPAGGEVIVRIREEDAQVIVCVVDQGIGLGPDDIPLLFQPYARLVRERRVGGLGLGLYVASGIVEAHGGRIWAESPGQGKGSTFCFTLPRAPSTPPTLPEIESMWSESPNDLP